MSHPAIGIGHPVSDPPRRPPADLMCAPQPRNLMVRYSRFSIRHTPYAIRNSEFGIPESGIGVQGFLHAMKDYPLTRRIMVR